MLLLQFTSNSIPILCFLLIFSIMSITSDSKPPPSSSSVYDVLREHGLPMGLLPKGVTKFEIDDGGRFQVYLDQACNAKFESELHYDRNVSGTLSYGRIGGLSGISAQELFLWFPVKGIRVDVPSSGIIYFDVGVVYKQFSQSLFETPPDCTAVAADVATVAKSELGKLRYGIDQEQHFGRGFRSFVGEIRNVM